MFQRFFCCFEPLDTETIEKRIQSRTNLKKVLKNLQDTYKKRYKLGVHKKQMVFRTAEDLSKLMALQKSTYKKLSKATVETLAMVLPSTSCFIQREIRGHLQQIL